MSFAIVDAAAGSAGACVRLRRALALLDPDREPAAHLPRLRRTGCCRDRSRAGGRQPRRARGARAGSRRREPMGCRGGLHDRPRARRPRGRPGRARASHLGGAGAAVPGRLPCSQGRCQQCGSASAAGMWTPSCSVRATAPVAAAGARWPSCRRVSPRPPRSSDPGAPVIERLRSPGSDHHDLADWLRTSDCRVAVCELGSHWRYSEETEELLIANRMMLDALPVPAVDGSFGDNNVVHGRVAISSSARVSGCILHGPVAVDENAVIEDSFIGPFTAIGAGAIISGAEIDNTMVLAGAEISHPGQRIEASIIGERASVVRSFALPQRPARAARAAFPSDSELGSDYSVSPAPRGGAVRPRAARPWARRRRFRCRANPAGP